MNDPRDKKPDIPPSPERDTSRKGREEEVINQQEEDKVTNSTSQEIVNASPANESKSGEEKFKEGIGDNNIKLDEVNKENLEGSDQTGREESGLPGSGI